MGEKRRDVYYLQNTKTGYIEGKFVVGDATAHYVTGDCYSVVGWYRPQTPVDFHFVADVNCKWDSCTHWDFYGEKYDPDVADSEIDSYYHLCGEHTFNDHIRLMCFVWKLAADIMTELGKNEEYERDITKNYFEQEETRKLVELMLDGYKIKKGLE